VTVVVRFTSGLRSMMDAADEVGLLETPTLLLSLLPLLVIPAVVSEDVCPPIELVDPLVNGSEDVAL